MAIMHTEDSTSVKAVILGHTLLSTDTISGFRGIIEWEENAPEACYVIPANHTPKRRDCGHVVQDDIVLFFWRQRARLCTDCAEQVKDGLYGEVCFREIDAMRCACLACTEGLEL